MYKPEENICEDFDTPQKERNMCMLTPLLGVEGICKHAALHTHIKTNQRCGTFSQELTDFSNITVAFILNRENQRKTTSWL